MPKHRRRAAGGSGGGGGTPAAAAALEEAPRAGGAAEYRPAEWLRRPLFTEEVFEMNRLLRAAGRGGSDALPRAEFERLRELMARHAGTVLWLMISASAEGRNYWRRWAEERLQDLRRLDPAAAEALEREAEASLSRFHGQDVRYRPGYESRLAQPLSIADGEVRRFRELWERWEAWWRREGHPLDQDEFGELHEYLQRRLVLPLRNARRAASPEELAAARGELLGRWRQLEDFAARTFPDSWESRHERLRAAVNEALGRSGGSGSLHPEAEALERARYQAMAAASGSTDPAELERAYGEFVRAREATEAAAERYRSAGAALPGELERALRLAGEWSERFRQELDRRRARNG